MEPCQINFVKREDFLRLVKENGEACLRATEQMSAVYNSACGEVRSLGLPHSASEKLAKLLLEWSTKTGKAAQAGARTKLRLTHEEIGQMRAPEQY
jgi:CRP/FNR family transcriptional regulator